MQALVRCTSLEDVPNAIAKVECKSELKRDMVALMSFFSKGDINKRKLSSWAFRQKVTATSINGQKVFWDFPLSGFNVSSYALTFQVICHWMADSRSWCASYRVWKKSSMWKLSLLVRLSFLKLPEWYFRDIISSDCSCNGIIQKGQWYLWFKAISVCCRNCSPSGW